MYTHELGLGNRTPKAENNKNQHPSNVKRRGEGEASRPRTPHTVTWDSQNSSPKDRSGLHMRQVPTPPFSFRTTQHLREGTPST